MSSSSLCLGCGLCCEGVLYSRALIQPDEIESVRALGLTVETLRGRHDFLQPCPLCQDHRCLIYTATRPSICSAYQCALLKKYAAGELTYEQGAQIIQRARELYADVIAQLPPGYSFQQLRREQRQAWDSGRGVFGSLELRQEHAALLLALAKLVMYLHKHFHKPKRMQETG